MTNDSSSASDNTLGIKNDPKPRPSPGRREAFVGLIAPIGVDLELVVDALRQALNKVKYQTNPVHLTDIFRENSDWYDVAFKDEVEKYRKYIKAGDKLCQETGRKDVIALYDIAKLKKYFSRGDVHTLPESVVHIFRQIKRVEEIEAFSEVYDRNIMFI